jgi:methionine--tRNA ligase beta chain
MKGDQENRRISVVRTAMEAVYAFTHFLAPVIPQAGQAVFDRLNTQPVSIHNLRDDFYNLAPGTAITLGDILFKKVETAAGEEKEKVVVKNKQVSPPALSAEEEEKLHKSNFSKVDIRVGLITKVWEHPTSDRLFCEEIDVGDVDGSFRPVASGLRQFYSAQDLLGKKVLLVCNLKESKFQGFMSFGMVLAAKSLDGNKVELVAPPIESKVGERVFISDGNHTPLIPPPFSQAKMKKGKIWESVSALLSSDDNCVASFMHEGELLPLRTSAGICSVSSLAKCLLS